MLSANFRPWSNKRAEEDQQHSASSSSHPDVGSRIDRMTKKAQKDGFVVKAQ